MPIRISRAAAANVKFSTPQEIVISHTDDSIKLGDGTSLFTSTTIGSNIGLDVNIINAPEIVISHTNDSIRVGDGTDLMEVNTDGSIDVTHVGKKIVETNLETSKSMASDFNSASQDVSQYNKGSISATWTTLDGTNSTMIIEGSNDNANWSEFGGDLGGIIIYDTSADTQIWEFTHFTTQYIRLAYKANNVSSGTVNINFLGAG